MTKLHSITIQDTAVLILTAESIANLMLLPSLRVVLSCSFANSLEVTVSWNKQQLVIGNLTVRTSLLKSTVFPGP